MLRRITAALAVAAALALTPGTAHAAPTAATPATAGAAFTFAPGHAPATYTAEARSAPTAAVATVGAYRIQFGDTLFGIAARFCGRGAAYPSLAAGNRIPNPNLIFAGATIRLTCTAAPTTRTVSAPFVSGSSRALTAVRYALAQLGKPYVWDAAGPWGFDCSGLILAAYARVGVWLPHQSEAQMNYGIPVSRWQLRPGDVLQPYFGHVVMYVGNGMIVEAARPGVGVEEVPLYGFWRARRYV